MPHSTIRLILIDAEPVSLAEVSASLQLHGDFEVVAQASSPAEALRQVDDLRPDAVFVDVATMGSSGPDLHQLLVQPDGPIIVFLAANRAHALEAFDMGAADYLLKPVNHSRLEISLNRIRKRLNLQQAATRKQTGPAETGNAPVWLKRETSAHITVTDRKRTRIIQTDHIAWISAACDYTELHVSGHVVLIREPISILLNRLPAQAFCRIHRSFAVNLSKVTGFATLRNQDLLVRMEDKTVLRASRTFSEVFRKAIMEQRHSSRASTSDYRVSQTRREQTKTRL